MKNENVWAWGFVKIPRIEVLGRKSQRLTAVEKQLLLEISARANHSQEPSLCVRTGESLEFGECCYGYREMGRELQRDHRRIITATNSLVRRGLIVKFRSDDTGTYVRLVDLQRVTQATKQDRYDPTSTRPAPDQHPTSVSEGKIDNPTSTRPAPDQHLRSKEEIKKKRITRSSKKSEQVEQLKREPKPYWKRQVDQAEVKRVRENIGEYVPYWKMPAGTLENFLPLFETYDHACDFIEDFLKWAHREDSGISEKEIGGALVGRIIKYTKQCDQEAAVDAAV